jgi:release factor glutamine methyltransferase
LRLGPHPDRARQDAETLLLHLLGKNTAWLMAHGDKLLPDDLSLSYSELFERRYCGEPIQYIVGEMEFYGLPFRVTPDVLIPRPETEHLVEKGVGVSRQLPRPAHCGCWHWLRRDCCRAGAQIASCRRHRNRSFRSHLAIARENAKRNGVAFRFLEGDLLAPVAEERFDFVVSNPPYVPETDRATLSVEVREYEPALALFAGDDGLEVYRRLIPAAFDALTPGGFVALEIGYGQSVAITELLTRSGFEQIEFVPDLQGIPRVACARRPS